MKKIKQHEEGLAFTIEVKDKNGKIIFTKTAPSKSYCKSWNQAYNKACGGSPSVTDYLGVTAAVGLFAAWGDAGAPIGTITSGIRAGLGSNAVTISDTALQTYCMEGTGANQFNHQAVTFTAPAVVGSTISFTVKRIMINNSAAGIAVTEIGLQGLVYQSGTPHYCLFCRDVFGAITIPIGGSMSVTYTLSVTV